MTTQVLINAQSFGTSTNVGNEKFSIAPVTLADGTTSYILNVQVIPGSGPTNTRATIRVWFTTTIRTVTSGNAGYTLGRTARYVDCHVGNADFQPSLAVSVDSELAIKTGPLLHCWCDVPNLPTAASLTVTVVELPS